MPENEQEEKGIPVIVLIIIVIVIAAFFIGRKLYVNRPAGQKEQMWEQAQTIILDKLTTAENVSFEEYDESKVEDLGNDRYRLNMTLTYKNYLCMEGTQNYTVSFTWSDGKALDISCELDMEAYKKSLLGLSGDLNAPYTEKGLLTLKERVSTYYKQTISYENFHNYKDTPAYENTEVSYEIYCDGENPLLLAVKFEQEDSYKNMFAYGDNGELTLDSDINVDNLKLLTFGAFTIGSRDEIEGGEFYGKNRAVYLIEKAIQKRYFSQENASKIFTDGIKAERVIMSDFSETVFYENNLPRFLIYREDGTIYIGSVTYDSQEEKILNISETGEFFEKEKLEASESAQAEEILHYLERYENHKLIDVRQSS